MKGGSKTRAGRVVRVTIVPDVPINYSSLGAFLQSVAKRYGFAQGHIGCGMKPNDTVLYISSSSGNVKEQTVEKIRTLVRGMSGRYSFAKPTSVTVCPAYIAVSRTSNHAESRIMHAWGEGNGDGATIRTTGPACGDCAYLMDQEDIDYASTSGIRSKTGWVHPFTAKLYGPQTYDAPHFYVSNTRGNKYKKP